MGKIERKNAWLRCDEARMSEVMSFNENYKKFISDCKTERECVTESIRLARENGFKSLDEFETLKAGDKVYAHLMNKTLALFVIGKESLEKGLNILGAHIDSPRIDVKQNPLYEDQDIALLDTHYYGGIKKYQWVATPLAIHGVVCKKDGTTINVVIGEEASDPVVEISDLLIHLAADQMSKPAGKVIDGEALNVTVGCIPLKEEEKSSVKANILKLLEEKYGFDEEDFISAELEVVPAGPARDCGFDRGMIMGYGHDDRVCAYTSLIGLFNAKDLTRTGVCLLTDKEEVGSIGATGANSKFFENTVAEVMNKCGQYSELAVRRALANSKMLSSDVAAAYDPNYPGVNEMKNTSFFSKGIVMVKFTGSRGKGGANDARPEFIAQLRNIFDEAEVAYQTSELGAVDVGGGGTIAYICAQYGMDCIDMGVAVQNMHAPWEVVSKIDVFEAMCAYRVFLEKAE